MELSCFWDSELWATGFGAPGLGRRIWGRWVWDRRVWGAGFGPPGLGRWVWDRRVWGAGFGAPGLGRRPPGGERVGFAVLSPPRTILSQALVSHGEEGNCSLRPLPCPLGKGRCRCAGSTLFALRAKALQSGAPHFGVPRKKQGFGAFYPSGKIPGAPGGAGNGLLPARNGVFPARRLLYVLPMSLSPQETEIRPISQTKRAPYSCKTFHVYPSAANAALYKSLLIAPSFRGEHPARPKPSFPRPQNPNFPPFPPPSHPPTIPQGERRALPAPAQGSRPLRIPFGGAALISPVARPPNAAGGKSLLVDLPPCTRSAAGTETKRSKSAPCSWGGLA